MKSEELPKERTLANLRKCSCCSRPMWDDGALLEGNEFALYCYDRIQSVPLSICYPCTDEADDQGITVEQLRESNNERSVETESY